MYKPTGKYPKLAVILAVALIATIIASIYFVEPTRADTAGNAGNWNMPATGAITDVYFELVYSTQPKASAVAVYFDNKFVASYTDTGLGIYKTATVDIDDVFTYMGDPHNITTAGSDGVTIDAFDAHVIYTPYYLIAVNSAYDSPTSSAWVVSGGNYTTSVTSPVSAGSGAQYVCTGYSIDSGGSTAGTNYTFTSITANHTITYNWQLQYQITFEAPSGMNSTSSGTVVTVDSVAKTYADLPFIKWVNNGTSVSFTYSDPVSSSIAHYRYALYSSASLPQTISAPTSFPSTYILTQYEFLVTYSASGLDASSSGTVVTVDGAAKTYANLPFSKYVAYGSSTTFSYGSTVASSTTGKQFVLSSSTGFPQTIYGITTISATYLTQYKLTVSTAYSSPYPAAETWYNAGSTVSCTVTSGTVAGSTGYQYVFASWTGSGSGNYTGTNIYPTNIIMNAPITETAVWTTQCYLTVTSTYFVTNGTGWYNQGASASFNLTAPVAAGTGARINFNGWIGTGTGSYTGSTQGYTVTMNNPITETSNSYVTQYYLTVTSAYGTTTGSGWYNDGSTAYAGLTSSTVSGGTGIQYSFQSWSVGGTNATQSNAITISAPTMATASWITQYYLTVTSPYGLPKSGEGWYNSGATAYAGVATNIDGVHTLLGWTGDASGTSITSNPITMSTAKTATAAWSTGSTPSGTASYNVTINGPYYENGNPAAGESTTFTLSFANNTIYQNTLNSSIGVADSIYIASTSPFTQLTWNASSTSSTLNGTRVYRFASGLTGINDTVVNLYILDPTAPAYQYTFSVSDYYGMINPYLKTSISPDGNHSYTVEQVNLNETGGYVVFVMQQYQIYTLTFICEQGSYSQTFTAATLGTPGQLAISLNVLAGNFPTTQTTNVITAYANRTASNVISTTYLDPTSNTTWVAITISHLQGTTSVTDYTSNSTGNSVTFTWGSADANTAYYITVTSLSGGVSYSFTLTVPSEVSSNPWAQIDWDNLGSYIPTLPATYTGWGGIDPTQLLAAMLILFALGIGSFYSTGASCLIAWVIGGVLLTLGWWQGSIPLFALAGVFTVLILFEEYKKGNFNL